MMTKCEEYTPEEIDRLVDVKYEEREGLFSCGSCNYFENDYCRQRRVKAKVEAEGCCIEWEGKSDFKPKNCKEQKK